jgi:tetratricopeptide (TPR) repeat protein
LLQLTLAALLALPALAASSPADREIAAAEDAVVRGAPDDYVRLAGAFMRKARETGDASYYERAAAGIERALSIDPQHYGALRARAWVLLGRHDFPGALVAAEAARAGRPDDWWNYGTLADAWVELGDYERATAAANRMVELRPGLPSYSRVAFLRSLFGDRAGAIEALGLAVAAGDRRDPESRAWVLVHLGHEHFGGGDLAAARAAYGRALDVLPEFSLALAGLGRVCAAEGRLAEAAVLYTRATERLPAPDLIAALGDVQAAMGDTAAAARTWETIEYMARVAEANGTTYGRQLALFYADHDRRLAEALHLAREDMRSRGGVYADDTLAWVLYKNRRLAEAKRAAARALRLGTEDASFHYHAGMIAAGLGRRQAATRHLARALALNPHFDLRQAPLARTTLASLDVPGALAARETR